MHNSELRVKAGRALDAGLWDEAVACYRRHLRQHPADLVGQIELARAHAGRCDFSECARQLRRTEAGMRGRIREQFLPFIAATWQTIREHAEAVRCLTECSAAGEPGAAAALARLAERRHDLPAALDWGRKALAGGEEPEALLAMAAVMRRTGAPAEAMDMTLRAEAAARSTGRGDLLHQALHGKALLLDARGECAAAMEAWGRAKEVARCQPQTPTAVEMARRTRLVRDAFRNDFSRELAESWRARAPAAASTRVFLAGHPRSGTTLLERILDTHPSTACAEECAAFHEFCYARPLLAAGSGRPVLEVLDQISRTGLQVGRAAYEGALEGFFSKPPGGRLVVDKHPSHTAILPAIARFYPDAPLIFPLRDPRDLLLSCFSQPLWVNDLSVPFFTLREGAAAVADWLSLWATLRNKLVNPVFEYRYEDLVSQPATVLGKLTAFLQLEGELDGTNFHLPRPAFERAVATPSYESVARPLSRDAAGKWKRYSEWINPVRPVLEPIMASLGYCWED